MELKGSSDWLVSIDQGKGPCGTVTYREEDKRISFPWEFVFGGNAIACIDFSFVKWSKYPWVTERRTEILERVAQEVIRQHAPNCVAEIRESCILIVETKQVSQPENQVSPSEKTVIVCPSCTQKLRAPADRGELTLTCPKCKYSWTWEPR